MTVAVRPAPVIPASAAELTAPHVAHVERFGSGDRAWIDWPADTGRAVLMIHGFNVQAHTWDPVAQALAGRAHFICPDLRGHGRSAWSEDGYRAQDFADDLVELMAHLGIDGCDVVGHSLGARVALAFCDRWPGTVGRLVLSDGGPEHCQAGALRGAAKGAERLARHGFSSPEDALAFYEEAHPAWHPVFRELHVQHQLKRNWAGKLVERSDPQLYWVTRGPGLKDNAYLWQCAERLRCPSLLMWGATSAYFDAELVERYRARFGGEFHDRRFQTGHYVPREDPAGFCAALADFLDL